MKLMIIVPIMCILAIGYIDSDTKEKEQYAQNYSAFESVTPEELHLEKIKFEMKMKEFDKLIWF